MVHIRSTQNDVQSTKINKETHTPKMDSDVESIG